MRTGSRGPRLSAGDDAPAGRFERAIAMPLDAKRQGRIFVAFEGLFLLSIVAAAIAEWFRIQAIQELARRGGPIGAAEADRIEAIPQLLSIVVVVASILAGIMFLVWIYRAYRNLEILRADGRKVTPGGAVGAFFIPFVNLVRPYQVAQELWRGSDPECTDEYAWTERPSSGLIKVWWFVRLAEVILSYVSSRMMLLESRHPTLESIVAALWVLFASYLVSIPASVAIIAVVLRISERQDRKFERLYGSQEPQL